MAIKTWNIDHYLGAWGRYRRMGNHTGLGYPSRNTIDRMVKEGPGASQSTAPIEYDEPDYVQEIQSAVNKLCALHKAVLEYYYINKHASHRLGAKKFNMPNTMRFRRTLDRAKADVKLLLRG